MFINWVITHMYNPTHIPHQPHAYISYRCVCTLFLCHERSQEFRLALREERQLLQSMAKDGVLVNPHGNSRKTIGKDGVWNQ